MEKNKRGLKDKAIICHCVAESDGLPLLNAAACSKFFETDPLPKDQFYIYIHIYQTIVMSAHLT